MWLSYIRTFRVSVHDTRYCYRCDRRTQKYHIVVTKALRKNFKVRESRFLGVASALKQIH